MRLARYIISIGILLIIAVIGCFIGVQKLVWDTQETFSQAVEVPLEEGQTEIVLDQTAVFGIPEGYDVQGNSYYSNTTALSKDGNYFTSICFENPAGETTISVAGWPSDTDEVYLELKEDVGKDPNVEIVKTSAGDAYFYYSTTDKNDQPLSLAAYIRIGDNTYCVEMENSDDHKVMTEKDIAAFKNYVQTIDQYHED